MTTKADEKPTAEWLPEFTPSADIVKMATAKSPTSVQADEREGYYGVPLLKRPKWRWEIALYFFFEGISAGSFLLGALADLSGNKRLRELARAAYDVSFLTLLPCPPPALRFGLAADFSARCSRAARSAMAPRRLHSRCRCRRAVTASRWNVLPKSKARRASAKGRHSSLILSLQKMPRSR